MSDDRKEFVSKINIIIKKSRYTLKRAVFAECFNLTVRDLPKKSVFEQNNPNLVDEMFSVTKNIVLQNIFQPSWHHYKNPWKICLQKLTQ